MIAYLQDFTDFFWPTLLGTHLSASLWFVVSVIVCLLFRRRLPAACVSLLWLLVILRFLIPSFDTRHGMFEVGYRMPNVVEAELFESSFDMDPFNTVVSTDTWLVVVG